MHIRICIPYSYIHGRRTRAVAELFGDLAVPPTAFAAGRQLRSGSFISQSATRQGIYARYLSRVTTDHKLIQWYFKRAIDSDPYHVDNLGNYAMYLWDCNRLGVRETSQLQSKECRIASE
jgi:hypothetical protein